MEDYDILNTVLDWSNRQGLNQREGIIVFNKYYFSLQDKGEAEISLFLDLMLHLCKRSANWKACLLKEKKKWQEK